LDWVRIFRQLYGLDWIGSEKMDPCPTLFYRARQQRIVQPTVISASKHSGPKE